MAGSGFTDIRSIIVNLKKMSVKNWLESSGIPISNQHKIFELHKYADDYFKKDYNLIETKNDCLIDMKMVILTGKK